MQVQWVFLGRDVKKFTAHQARRDVPNPGAQLEYRVPQVRAKNAGQPAQILRRAGEIVEKGAAEGLDVQIVDQPETQNYAERFHAVLPTDFLAFFIRPAVIADGNFVNAQLALGALHGDLRLKTKAVRSDGNAL